MFDSSSHMGLKDKQEYYQFGLDWSGITKISLLYTLFEHVIVAANFELRRCFDGIVEAERQMRFNILNKLSDWGDLPPKGFDAIDLCDFIEHILPVLGAIIFEIPQCPDML